jgi:putative chitinase
MSFNFEFSVDSLKEIIGNNAYAEQWHEAITNVCPEYEIDTPSRLAAFLAQCAHESGNFKFLKENLNYRATSLRKVFPKYFSDDAIAEHYASQPDKQAAIANRIYANRMGNGDEASGDGYRYCGRGLIQLTGKNNYTLFAASIGIEVEEASEYLGTFEGAVQSACWFWDQNNLNNEADAGDIKRMTRKINGGYIGLEDRIKHYEHALHIFGGHVEHAAQEEHSGVYETVKKGSRGSTVKALQEKLGLSADGAFGPGTERALKEWQSANGLVADGIAGPATLQKLLG